MSKLINRSDLAIAANILQTGICEIQTVAEVESRGGGFMPDGRVTIRFEGHIFKKLTKGKYDASYPTISHPYMVNCPYNRGVALDYIRLRTAMSLDADAAMQSCSWGMFQIMGFHFDSLGFESVGLLVDAMKISEGEQLKLFCEFIYANDLDEALRDHNWPEFAKRYNGLNYKGDPNTEKDDYDLLLAKAFAKFSKL